MDRDDPTRSQRGILAEILGSCGLDGLPALAAVEALIDRAGRMPAEGDPACR